MFGLAKEDPVISSNVLIEVCAVLLCNDCWEFSAVDGVVVLRLVSKMNSAQVLSQSTGPGLSTSMLCLFPCFFDTPSRMRLC